jgi:hypothetical protein
LIWVEDFQVHTAPVPLISSREINLDPHAHAAVFSLDETHLKALSTLGCFHAPEPLSDV